MRAGEFLEDTSDSVDAWVNEPRTSPMGRLQPLAKAPFGRPSRPGASRAPFWGFAGEGGSWGLIGKEPGAGVRRLGSDCRLASPACAAYEDAVRWATGARNSIDVSDLTRSEPNA